MRGILLIFISASVMLSIGGCAIENNSFQECTSKAQFKQFSTPHFESYIMNVRESGKSRIDVYSQLKFKDLRFEKNGNGFRASYTMRYTVRDSDNTIVATKDVDRSINVASYEESISSKMDSFLQSFPLLPGRYTIGIESIDNLSKLRSRTRTNTAAADFSKGPVRASTLLLLNTLIPGGRGLTLRPVLPSSVSTLTDTLGIFQEFYGLRPDDTMKIMQRYYRTTVQRDSEKNLPSFLMPPYRTSEEACTTVSTEPYFTAETTVTGSIADTYQSVLFYPLPSVGYSIVERNVTVRRGSVAETLSVKNEIFRRERKFLNSVSVDEELSVLRYILREQEYDSLAAGDAVLKNNRINAFWRDRGGLERRKEFVRKIVEADAMFTLCDYGSRTAMGIVSVVCGTPDGIDCKGDFIETWYYTIGERSYAVEFRTTDEEDRTFELVPFSVSDVLWQYSLDQWRRKR